MDGFSGEKGVLGRDGFPGLVGWKGIKGSQGSFGYRGPDGVSGKKGKHDKHHMTGQQKHDSLGILFKCMSSFFSCRSERGARLDGCSRCDWCAGRSR